MTTVDRHGLSLSVCPHAANHHEVTLVQLTFDFYMIEAKPENPIGDRAYDSDKLNEVLRSEGIEMICSRRMVVSDQQPRTAGAASLPTALDCGTSSPGDAVAPSSPDSLGVLPGQLPRLCAARRHLYPPQTVLR
jgi:hypothetical protein